MRNANEATKEAPKVDWCCRCESPRPVEDLETLEAGTPDEGLYCRTGKGCAR